MTTKHHQQTMSIAKEQHDLLNHLVDTIEQHIRMVFEYQKTNLMPMIRHFQDDYASEIKRLEAQRDDDDDESVKVPPHWLVTSGWQRRLSVAMSGAATHVGQQALAHISMAQHVAVNQGHADAMHMLTHMLKMPKVN